MKFVNPEIQADFDSISPLLKYQVKQRFELAKRFNELIKSKGHTYENFAKLIDVDTDTLMKWLSGFHNFNIDTISLLEYHLNTF